MRKWVKVSSVVLTAMLLVSTASGCTSKKGDAVPGNSETKSTSTQAAGNSLPIMKQTTKIRIYQQNYASNAVQSYDDILVFQELEKRTGFDIEWIHPTSNDQLAMMVASNDLPDIIYNNWGTNLVKYLDDKVVIKLNDLIDKYAPDVSKLFAKNPEVKRQVMLDDGAIAMFPQVDLDLSRNYYKGFMVRKDWLDKVNLPAPATIDDWQKVLQSFKDRDPNGNGKADEIPFSDEKGGGVKAFSSAWGVRDTFHPDAKTGKIVFGPIEPAYKEYLTTMAKWYKTGLIDNEYAVTDRKVLDSKMNTSTLGSYFGNLSYMTTYMNQMKGKDPNFKIVAAPYPVGPAGKGFTSFDQTTRHIAGYGGAITTACKYPVEVAKLCNYFYSSEGDLLLNWGLEGKTYTVENGKKKFTDLIMKSPDGKLPSETVNKYVNNQYGWMRVFDMDAVNAIAVDLPKEAQESAGIWGKADTSILMPLITPTVDESRAFGEIMAEINTYKNQMFTKFVTGAESLDKFDDYVSTIKKMRVDEALKIQQTAYDRYKARK